MKKSGLPFSISGNFLIDEQWGVEQLANFLSEIDMLNSGVSLKDLGYEERKKKSMQINYYFPDGRLIAETSDGTTPEIPPGSIAHLNLTGVMRMEDGLCSQGMRSLVSSLATVDADPSVKGIILEVNSGGGEVTAGQALYSAIADLQTPLVVISRFMASAAVLGTLPAKKIIALGDTSAHGSIGTLFSMDKEFAAWYAENIDDIYATGSSQKNIEWREYLKGNRKVYEKTADQYNGIFQGLVTKHRNLPEETQSDTLKGGMFLAAEAQERGLVHQVGTMKDAFNYFKNNSKTQTMNFQAAYRALVAECNRIFGISMSDNDAEAVQTEMAKLQTLEDFKAGAVAELNKRLTDMQTQLDGLTSKFNDLTASADQAALQVTDLQGKLDTLKAENDGLKTEKTDLEAKLADEIGKVTQKTGGHPLTTVDKFLNQIEQLEVVGDSKY